MNLYTHIIPVNQYTEGFESEKLVVEQYQFPVKNPNRTLFFVFAHAIGFQKDLYHPLLTRIGERLRGLKEYSKTEISFFSMDSRYHGDSSIINKRKAPSSYRWIDNASDIKQVVEYFDLKQRGTVIGIGHSWGAACMLMCEETYTNTFDGLFLIDPAILAEATILVERSKDPVYCSLNRKDTWPNRKTFEASVIKNPFWKHSDSAVLKKYLSHSIYGIENEFVQLKCSKEHESNLIMHSSLECVMTARISKRQSIPAYYIYGTRSFLRVPEIETIIRSNPNNTFVVLKGSHMIAFENIEDISSQAINYLQSLNQTTSLARL